MRAPAWPDGRAVGSPRCRCSGRSRSTRCSAATSPRRSPTARRPAARWSPRWRRSACATASAGWSRSPPRWASGASSSACAGIPRVALAYHAREHGFAAANPRYVLVQGSARIVEQPDRAYLDEVVTPAATRFLGAAEARRLLGPLAGRLLRRPRAGRGRGRAWSSPGPTSRARGTRRSSASRSPRAPGAQSEPKKGTGPRVDVAPGRPAHAAPATPPARLSGGRRPPRRAAGRGRRSRPRGDRPALPGAAAGGRAAAPACSAHRYNPQLIGLASRVHTGWLTVEGEHAIYAPHTEGGFLAPANKTLLLLGNGYLARRGLARARRTMAASG